MIKNHRILSLENSMIINPYGILWSDGYHFYYYENIMIHEGSYVAIKYSDSGFVSDIQWNEHYVGNPLRSMITIDVGEGKLDRYVTVTADRITYVGGM